MRRSPIGVSTTVVFFTPSSDKSVRISSLFMALFSSEDVIAGVKTP